MNNNTIYFISADEVKQRTSLMNDIDDKSIAIHILEAQDNDLQPILFENYYEYLVSGMTDYIDNGLVVADKLLYLAAYDWLLLDNYITPYLVYSTLYHSAMDLFLSITNSGVVSDDANKSRGNNGSTDKTYFQTMRIDWKNNQTNKMNEMLKFITDNIEEFPLYALNIDDCNTQQTTTRPYGIYMGKNF